MKIYFSCSLTGGRADEKIYGVIVDDLLAQGHEVLTAHLARPEVMAEEQRISPREVYERDIQWLKEADVLIAEVSTPSHGVGYEIAFVLLQGKPALCCYRAGARVSKMITGNNLSNLTVRAYGDEGEALKVVQQFLESYSQPPPGQTRALD